MRQVSRCILSLFKGFDVDARDKTGEQLEESENTEEKFEGLGDTKSRDTSSELTSRRWISKFVRLRFARFKKVGCEHARQKEDREIQRPQSLKVRRIYVAWVGSG